MSTPQLPPQGPVFQPKIAVASGADESGSVSANVDSTTARFNARDVSQSNISTSRVNDAAGSFTNGPGNERRGVREPGPSTVDNPTFARARLPLASSGDTPITASSAPLQLDEDLVEDPKVNAAVKWTMTLFKALRPVMDKEHLDCFTRSLGLQEMSRPKLETAQPDINVPINLQEQSIAVKTNSESVHQLPGTNEMILTNQLYADIGAIEQQLLEKLSAKDQKIENTAELASVFQQFLHLNRVVDTIPSASEKARLKQRLDGLKNNISEWFFAIPAFSAIKKMKSELENLKSQTSPDATLRYLSVTLDEFDLFFKIYPSGVAIDNLKREIDILKSSVSDIQKNV